MAAVINALARLPQRKHCAQDSPILLAHTPRRASDHAEVFALADVLSNVSHAAPANEDEIWMISYMDIMTVLLTLFVLLLAIAKATPDSLSTARGPVVHKAVAKAEARAVLPPGKIAKASPSNARPTPAKRGTSATSGVATKTNTMALLSPIWRNVAAAAPVVLSPLPAQGARKPAPPAHAANDWLTVLQLNPLGGYPQQPVSPLHVVAGAPGLLTSAVKAPAIEPTSTQKATPAAPASARDKLLASLQASPLGKRIETTVDQDNVSLEISDNILFDTGSASLQKRGQAVLDELAALLATQNYTVSVEGHSDNVAFASAVFASNWELSATRATHVTRYLIAQGIAASRLRAIGYADTHPRADNSTAEGRARNRRVSLVLHLPLSPVLPADH